MQPTRPVLRYLGGKWRMAPRIIAHFPAHQVYVEPFGGAGSVLLRKPKTGPEVYNDLDGELVNLFRVLQTPALAERLIELVSLTPFAREEWTLAYERTEEPVERARRLIIRAHMGQGATASNLNRTTGFRSNVNRRGTVPSLDWARFPPALAVIAERIQCGVAIERRPALDLIRQFDAPGTLIYADPPYVHSTRSQKMVHGELYCSYAHEMDEGDHADLLEVLAVAKSMVVLSGYANPLYDGALRTWERVEIATHADCAQPRTEVLWLNPAAAGAERLAA